MFHTLPTADTKSSKGGDRQNSGKRKENQRVLTTFMGLVGYPTTLQEQSKDPRTKKTLEAHILPVNQENQGPVPLQNLRPLQYEYGSF